MLKWYIRKLVFRTFEQLNRRELDAVMGWYAEDAYFRFPGTHELAIEARSKAEIGQWFERLFRRLPSLRFDIDDVVVQGPPWNMRLCTRYRARTESATGAFALYEGMQYAQLRWCTVTREELFPDTQSFANYLKGALVG